MLKQHPLSALWPQLPSEEFAELVADIRKHGLLEPGVVYEGAVLDGWNRYRACKEAGIKFVTQPYTGKDPRAFVDSRNGHRRHINATQRAAIRVAMYEWKPNGGDHSQLVGSASKSAEEMAHEAHVSTTTIEQAKAGHLAGLGEEMRDGKVSAKKAAEVAKLPPKKRERAVAAIKAGEPVKTKATSKQDAPDYQALYEEAKQGLQEMTETARELEDRLSSLECKEPDEQQKEILRLKKEVAKLEAEVKRVTRDRSECQTKCNELIRQVKMLDRKVK